MPGSTGDGIDLSKIRELEERLSKFRIETSPDMTIRGNAWQGFALNSYSCDEIPESQGGNPIISTGACCIGTDCSITTQVGCTIQGGTYQGDGTTCSPNPCGEATGACCTGGECSILSESDCTGMSGTYQGDGTMCDPNPCVCCGSECCGVESPFMDGDGNCWTQIEEDCEGTFTYSGSVPCGGVYSRIQQTVTCCDACEGQPILNQITVIDEFCHFGFGCDNTTVCTCPNGEGDDGSGCYCHPDTCTLQCGAVSFVQTVSNLCDCPDMGTFSDPFFQNN